MNVSRFISRIRVKRNHLEERLRKCENKDIRDTLTRKIEMLNIMLQEFGQPAYVRKKKAKPKF
jgi:hypothetical protein